MMTLDTHTFLHLHKRASKTGKIKEKLKQKAEDQGRINDKKL